MRGHEAIIAMRKQGAAPDSVWIGEYGVDPNWHRYSDATVDVEILPSERVDSLDLRWAIGLTLHIQTDGEKRLNELLEAFDRVKPKRVLGAAFERKEGNFGRFEPECIRLTDTQGVMVWQQ